MTMGTRKIEKSFLARMRKLKERFKYVEGHWHFLYFLCAIILFVSTFNTVISNNVSNFLAHVFRADKLDRSIQLVLSDTFLFRSASKTIMARNLFNHLGEIPLEDQSHLKEEMENPFYNFENIPCTSKTDFGYDVKGVLYSTVPQNRLVVLKQKGQQKSQAETLHERTLLPDNNSLGVFQIPSPTDVQFKSGQQKVCVSIAPPPVKALGERMGDGAHQAGNVVLTGSYVQQELGPGYSKILRTLQFVPQMNDNTVAGFVISGVAKNSLFETLGMRRGDLVTQVGPYSLKNVSLGTKIYEIFTEESDFVFDILRDNKVIKIHVKVE